MGSTGSALAPVTAEPEAYEDDQPDEAAGAIEDDGEPHDAPTTEEAGVRYTRDLSDEQLTELWKTAPEKLGSISVGFVDEGRMINSVQFPRGDQWIVVTPSRTWGTQETIDDVIRAVHTVREEYPDSPPLRVNQISARDGGYLRPHKSHQSGRDVDLGFYYPTVQPVRARAREKYIDVKRTWALLRALITETDVQKVLLDRHVQRVLYDYALASGEDKAWLDSIFHAGRHSIVVHARGHRDHLHVRFFNARAQELGRRVAPLLALRPDQNLAFHRVHRGDTLGALALRFSSSVKAIRKANHLRGSMLHLAQVLRIPLRGPCTRCPVPAAVVVPPRRLPPQLLTMQLAEPAPVALPITSASALSAAFEVSGSAVENPPVKRPMATAATSEAAVSPKTALLPAPVAPASPVDAKSTAEAPHPAAKHQSGPQISGPVQL